MFSLLVESVPSLIGFEPAYLVEFFKVGQVTWFCTKLGQVTWICKILDQVTWSAQFAQGQITWFLEFEGQVTWIVDDATPLQVRMLSGTRGHTLGRKSGACFFEAYLLSHLRGGEVVP